MPNQYTKDEIWKIHEKLPQELQEAVFSAETADAIFNSCERNNVEVVSRVAYYTGLVLMGLILPQDFAATLKKELGLAKTIAESVASEINRFVFYPVKPALEQLHRMEIEVTAKVVTPKPEEQSEQSEESEEKPEEPGKSDSYREPVE